MNLTAKFRLAALGVAAGLMGVLIALATVLSQKKAAELHVQLNAVDSESFGISEHFKDQLREVNNIRLHYIMGRAPAAWRQFLDASHKLDRWLDEQAPQLTTRHEKDALRELKNAYDDYLAATRRMHEADQTNGAPTRAGRLQQFARAIAARR